MPAPANRPATLPRFLPHPPHFPGVADGPAAGAGLFPRPESKPRSLLASKARSSALPAQVPAPAFDGLAHDARNILSGLMLYCDLLAGPGVLTTSHIHYAKDLESIVRSTVEIVERMAVAQSSSSALQYSSGLPVPSAPVTDAAPELRHLQPLLAAIAGPSVRLSVATMPCAGAIALAVEDLTRILVNLVRNAADAMPAGGHIGITVQYGDRFDPAGSSFPPCSPARSIVFSVADDGPGIPPSMRSRVFEPGFTSHDQKSDWPAPRRRGLGLSIVRDLVETAGGAVVLAPVTCGARFEITLPLIESITSDTCAEPPNSASLLTYAGEGA